MLALIVDDSSAMRVLLAQMIGELGFETMTAVDGAEALELIEQGLRPDFALVDWNMPVLNGLEFVKRIRSCPEHSGMRVMMVTTENEMDQVMRAVDAGADEYVMKPFTKDIIVGKLALLGLTQSC